MTGHLDPIITDDEEVNALREKTATFVKNIDSRLTIHDFRMVRGERHTNVLLDVAVPFDITLTHQEIRTTLEKDITACDERYRCIITIEHSL